MARVRDARQRPVGVPVETDAAMSASSIGAARRPRGQRARRLLIVGLGGVIATVGLVAAFNEVTRPRRTTPVFSPPVLAGQVIPGYCSSGVYARHGATIVLTTSPHCADEGMNVYDPGATTIQGVMGPTAREATCPVADHWCAPSDMNYLVVSLDRIPWGHLNLVDLGTAGYRTIPEDAKAYGCGDIALGDVAEMDGRTTYRTGAVVGKGENRWPADQDGAYFPCMITADIQVGGGDSGSVVLVRGIPAGVTSRTFGGTIGFTPLAEGLANLGLEMCTTPNCGLTPPR